MPAKKPPSRFDRYFDALTESADAMMDALKAANERGFRLSSRVIREVEEGQREAVELARKAAQNPSDIAGFMKAAVETTTKAQRRALNLTRAWFEEAGEAGRGTREMFERILKANRAAGQAAVEVSRQAYEQATQRFRGAVGRAARRVEVTVEEAPPKRARAARSARGARKRAATRRTKATPRARRAAAPQTPAEGA